MRTGTTLQRKVELEKRLKVSGNGASYFRSGRIFGTLLWLLGVWATLCSARAETITLTNSTAITTPNVGAASYYPSYVGLGGFIGKITAVRVTLNNITHTYPDDYDILLVGPGGQKVILMSDCGGNFGLNNISITFSDASPPLPDGGLIPSGTYRPTNYPTGNDPLDTFPPDQAQAYSASLAVFNNTSPNGTWNLYVVDDAAGDTGSINGGWTLELDTTGFRNIETILIPDSGIANPYPSLLAVGGLPPHITKARVTLQNNFHSYPDDLDIMVVGPGGQNAIIMSDAGGNHPLTGQRLVFDDAAVNFLPDDTQIAAGTYKPTNFGAGDTFPAPAPAPAGTSTLSVFNGTNPNGTWGLYVVDDSAGDFGNMNGWALDFDLAPTTLANISTRLPVETGDNVLIGGFIVTGTQPKRVIVRAIGPSLNLPGKLGDPALELRDGSGALVWSNDDWQNGSAGFPSQEAEIIATGIPPTNAQESAIVATLPANNSNYTAIVRGYQTQTGIALVEAYDLDPTVDSKLANISTRGLVQTGDNVLIAGMIVLGELSDRVIVRAIGPSLSLPGKLADPTLELRDSNGVLLGANDNWKTDQQAEILATTIPPSNDSESAIVATLPSNGASYTAIVRGVNGTTGVAVVEVYALQ